MPRGIASSKVAVFTERSATGVGCETSREKEEETTFEVKQIPDTQHTIKTDSDRLSYSLDGSRNSDLRQTKDGAEKDKKTKWGKLKAGLSRSSKSLGRRLKIRNAVQQISVPPSAYLNGEYFVEVDEAGRKEIAGAGKERIRRSGGLGQRRTSDEGPAFASRADCASSAETGTSLSQDDSSTDDTSLVIYDVDDY